jgi:hypothetical protein
MTYLPVIIDKLIASCNGIPSNIVNIDTPNANATAPSGNTLPGTWLCQEEAIVRIGPQKNPNPKSGKIKRKIVHIGCEISPGQMSPKPTLCRINTINYFGK